MSQPPEIASPAGPTSPQNDFQARVAMLMREGRLFGQAVLQARRERREAQGLRHADGIWGEVWLRGVFQPDYLQCGYCGGRCSRGIPHPCKRAGRTLFPARRSDG